MKQLIERHGVIRYLEEQDDTTFGDKMLLK